MEGLESSKQSLNAYIHDFLVKSAFNGSARTFFEEAGLQNSADVGGSEDLRVAVVDSPQSYLYEWWQIFWELCSSKTKRSGGVFTGSAAVQTYYESWSEKDAQAATYRAQEVKAASLQQMAEDAGEYRDETVDGSELALIINSVPLQENLRGEPVPVAPLEKEFEKVQEKDHRDQSAGTGSNASVSTTVNGMNLYHSHVSSQELPSFDLEGLENDPDYLIFTSPEAAPLPIDFPPIPGEDISFLDNNNERTFNFLNGM